MDTVALIVLYDRERRLLLQHRTENAPVLPGYWAFFGGGIKEGETPEDAVRREAVEELNYKLKAPLFFIKQYFKTDTNEGCMYVYIEAFNEDKSFLTLQEGQGWGWYHESETDSLKMINHDRKVIKLINQYLDSKINSSEIDQEIGTNILNKNLAKIAQEARKLIIEVAWRSKSVHVGPALSCVDLLVALYFHELNINEKDWANRDIFVLSKAHAAMALYAILTMKGIISREIFMGYLQNDGTLPAHLDRFTSKGIEVSAGSLGHGFNMALGMAYGYKARGDKRKIYTLIGDGESQEGSIWEGALFGSKLGLDNFTAIMDYNNLQGYGRAREICSFEPIKSKWESFGWHAIEIDGHDIRAVKEAFVENSSGKPKIIIAHTTKGKGVSFMEDQLIWHYYIVTDEHRNKALQELDK
jgi:transketolase